MKNWKEKFKNDILLVESEKMLFFDRPQPLKYISLFIVIGLTISLILFFVGESILISSSIGMFTSLSSYKLFCFSYFKKQRQSVVSKIQEKIKPLTVSQKEHIIASNKNGINYDVVYYNKGKATLRSPRGSLFLVSFKNLLYDYKINNIDFK